MNGSLEQIPETAEQVRLKLVQPTTLVLRLIISRPNNNNTILRKYTKLN
jgi:hypothetical protein